MQLIDHTRLAELRRRADASPRRRTNHNFHTTADDPVQRLLNALEPGSYVRPHRHTTPPKWEMFVLLAGGAAVLRFDDAGRVTQRVELTPGGPVFGIEIPAGAWHTLVALAPGTVLMEVKPGPYAPLSDKDFASWAPAEGSAAAAAFLARMEKLQPGDDASAAAVAK